MIEIQTLCNFLAYDSTTGDLVWKQHVSDKVRAGRIAGSQRKAVAMGFRGCALEQIK